MSAQLRPEGASPMRVAHPRTSTTAPASPGDAAFDRWLRRELGRLYDAALEEPVPDELMRLLDRGGQTDKTAQTDKAGKKDKAE